MFLSYTNLAAAALIITTHALPLDMVSITDVSHWGTGCPQDTSNFWVKADGNSIQASFGSFDVKTSPQDQMTEFCGLGVTLSSPQNQQFSAASTSYHDNIDVGAGTTGSHILTYTFQGSQAIATTRHDFVGPVKGGFDITDTVPAGSRVWSACGAPLELLITNRGSVTTSTGNAGTSYFNDGVVTTAIEWRSC